MRRGDLVRIIPVPPGGFFQILATLPHRTYQTTVAYSDVFEPEDLCVVLQTSSVKKTNLHPGGVYAQVLTPRARIGWISCKHIDVVSRCNLAPTRNIMDS